MKTNPNKLWIVVFVLGWCFDFLFWKQTPGINFALFALLCVSGALYLLLGEGLRPPARSLGLLPLIGFFAAVTFIRSEPMTTFLAGMLTLFTMFVLSVTYLGGRWMEYSLGDYISKSFALLASAIARPITFNADARTAQADAGVQPPKFNLWPIVRGVVFALPIVAVFAALLSSADLVFSHRLKDFIDLFNLQNLPEYIFRLIYILIIGYGLAGIVLHAASESKDSSLLGEDKPVFPAFVGFIESTIILGSVIVLFAAFVIIQFQYFFGGRANINVEGFTYSQYAVRGFGELITVAFFALLMLLTLSAVTKRESEIQRRTYSGLGVALVSLLIVMLFSAYQRLSLYEAVYGFSRLRTYTHVFLIWLGLLLVATIALEIIRRERLFTFAMLIASFGFAASLPMLNVDKFIVLQNIRREVQGVALQDKDRAALDAQYFVQLSDDSIPVLVDEFKDPAISPKVHEQIGAALACIRNQRKAQPRSAAWQSFHFARLWSDQALASVKTALDKYSVVKSDWSATIMTPSKQSFDCNQYYND